MMAHRAGMREEEPVSRTDPFPGENCHGLILSNRYDRLGRLIETGTSGSLLRRAYDEAGNLLGESWTAGPLSGVIVTNIHDSLGRRITNGLLSGGTWLVWSTNGYDAASRLAVVSEGTNSAEYTYLTGSSLATNIVFRQSGNERMRTTKYFDTLNRLTMIVSSNSVAGVVSSHAYTYNAGNQRARADLGGTNSESPTYWVYTYDSLGQVISGKKYWADGTPVAGQQFEYGFDDIGNRQTAASGGDQWGANLRYENYSANNLNQYTSRTVPGSVDVLGEATNTATVTVNLQPTYRRGEYFRANLALDNQASAVYAGITNVAVLRAATTNDADTVTTNTGFLLLPKTPETFSYDADGNLTTNGLWVMTWDAENRPITTESANGVPTGARQREQWTYLPDGRWIQRIVSAWDGGVYVAQWTNRYVWDGPVLRAVLDHTNGLEQSYLRGLDLSGSLQGAGGVGGLLAITTATNGTHFYAFDGNGNVAALVDADDGNVSAIYEYDPFGNELRATGPMARENLLRFSSQFADDVTGDVKYLFRPYRPSLGRWPNRDPIGELGHEALRGMSVNRRGWNIGNLYGFVYNNPTENIDTDGREIGAICGRCGQYYVGECPRCGRQPPGDDVDYPWYVDALGAACDIGSTVSICFDIATFPSGEGAAATVCLQACKQSAKNRIKAKIACDLLYSRIHGNPRGTGACDKPQTCDKSGMPMGWYLERAANALECSALRTAWLRKCACKGLKNKKWHGKDWEEHWKQAGWATANAAICLQKAKDAGWKGDVPTIP